ncbi:MAG: DUF1667 domain-containing protein [Eubacteriales bacterium]|nr:DUF1667 domain-containing protein [Eubacteriales bacterium]
MKKEMICIVCPRGCHLQVDSETLQVTGNGCEKGVEYGRNEMTNPTRVVCSTVKLQSDLLCRCPVKTDRAIPKDKIMDVMTVVNQITAEAPVQVGQVLCEGIAGTEANLVVTRTIAH